MRKTVRCHQNHRFFTLCHCPVSRFSWTAFLPPFRMTTDDKRHPEAMSKTIRRHPEAIAKDLLPWGGKVVRCHQNHRFFTLCHVFVSCLSYTAFLPPFRMTTDDKRHPERCRRLAAVMKKTIRRHPKRMWRICHRGGETVRCHQSHRFFTLCHVAVSWLSHKAFLPPFRMTIGGRR